MAKVYDSVLGMFVRAMAHTANGAVNMNASLRAKYLVTSSVPKHKYVPTAGLRKVRVTQGPGSGALAALLESQAHRAEDRRRAAAFR